MGLTRRLVIALVAVLAWYLGNKFNTTPPLPQMDPNPWWGPGEPHDQNTNIRPFKINISAQDVDDLKARLMLPPRIVPSLEGTNFTYGVNSAAMSVILKYWKDNYDWKKREKKLNGFSHFKTRIEGLDMHFLRASPPPGSGKVVRPLLILHGWPGSFVEFYDILPLLTTPRPDSDVVFDVICPSLPGFGFSEGASKPGLNTLGMAQIFVKLMERLGFDQFYAQGGDWGSAVITDIATVFPQKLLGIHLNMVVSLPVGAYAKLFLGSVLPPGFVMDPRLEFRWYPLSSFYGMLLRETGYAHIQSTKPDTIGVALSSSPQGLAAYILEKFSSLTNMGNLAKKDGGLLDPDFPISLDAMLDNICVYWFTNSITTSMRIYAEYFNPSAPYMILDHIPTSVPAGLAIFAEDIIATPKNLAAHKFYNIVTYTNPPMGGHFAAMEVPKILADDLLNFVNTVERNTKTKTGSKASDQGKKAKQEEAPKPKQAKAKPTKKPKV